MLLMRLLKVENMISVKRLGVRWMVCMLLWKLIVFLVLGLVFGFFFGMWMNSRCVKVRVIVMIVIFSV